MILSLNRCTKRCLCHVRLFTSTTDAATNSGPNNLDEAVEYMRKEMPKAYEYYQKYQQYQQEYMDLTKDSLRPLQTGSDDLERVAAQCGLKLPKTPSGK